MLNDRRSERQATCTNRIFSKRAFTCIFIEKKKRRTAGKKEKDVEEIESVGGRNDGDPQAIDTIIHGNYNVCGTHTMLMHAYYIYVYIAHSTVYISYVATFFVGKESDARYRCARFSTGF